VDHQILDEVFRSLTTNRPDLDEKLLQRTRELMCRAVDALTLPDPDDRHVLAAAITARALCQCRNPR